MKKLITALLFASLSFCVSAETLRFGTEASYAPFESIDSNNQLQGFDIDLANALCKEMNVTCIFNNQAFDSLIPSLKFKRIDAAIAAMDITAERSKQVTFSQPYYQNSALFIGVKDKQAAIDDLNGKRVGMQNGTTHQKYLSEKYPNITAVPYDSYQNAILDLKNGRLDAVFGDSAIVGEWLKTNPQLAVIGDKISDQDYFGTGLGIAMRKGNQALVDRVNAALVKLKADGTYQAIYQKWFQ